MTKFTEGLNAPEGRFDRPEWSRPPRGAQGRRSRFGKAARPAEARYRLMPGTFSSINIFAFDLDEGGRPVQAWETVVDEAEAKASRSLAATALSS